MNKFNLNNLQPKSNSKLNKLVTLNKLHNNSKITKNIIKNTKIDDQYIHGEVAEALQRKTEIERQASEDYENGLISEDEAMERDEQASEILNQAVENQYGSQD